MLSASPPFWIFAALAVSVIFMEYGREYRELGHNKSKECL